MKVTQLWLLVIGFILEYLNTGTQWTLDGKRKADVCLKHILNRCVNGLKYSLPIFENTKYSKL